MHSKFLLDLLLYVLLWVIGEMHQPDNSFPNQYQLQNVVCNVQLDAGPDQFICQPDIVQLDGTADNDVLFTLWNPASGLSDPDILDPTADVSNTITYTLTGWGIDPNNPNIIINGDFEEGNTGFTSDYLYQQDVPVIVNELEPEGTFTVIDNPALVHYDWSACMDHTPGTADQLMLINGDLDLLNFWCQTVDVLPGTYYNVEAWVSSVHPVSPAVLQFSINGTPIGPIINAPSETCEWIPFNALWNAGSNTSAEICIINLNTTAFGNDFALDDITMVALCEVSDEVTIYIEEEPAPEPQITGPELLCIEDFATYTAILPSEPIITTYIWSAPGATILDGQGTNEITVQWEDIQSGMLCVMIETECGENENCFEVTINEVPEFPFISGPTTICPGEQATFFTQDETNVEFNWIVPPQVNIISGEGTNEILIESLTEGEVDICIEIINDCGIADNCTTLFIPPAYQTQFDTTLCAGSTITINGTVYGNGNLNGIEDFSSINGCDSLVEITISEAASLEFMNAVSLCPGDSIFLEGGYQTQEGTYIDTFITASGCDSIIITEVIISSSDTTYVSLTTCDPDEAGSSTETFITGNCDSTVITQTTLVPSDTILIIQASCIAADTGQVIFIYTNQFGCDSIVTIRTLFQFSDTTRLFQTSCDIADVGVFVEALNNVNGCDSLIITTVSFSLADTTEVSFITCFIDDTSTTSTLLSNINGCDSLVITHTIYSGTDTTFFNSSSCHPSDTGWSHLMLVNQNGCDSIISTYVNFMISDTTYIFISSCNPLDTGINIELLVDQLGCDSIVITETGLGPGLIIDAVIDSMYGGFGVPCFGDNAGAAHVDIISGGSAPFTVDWSNGDTTFVLSDLLSGKYFVIVSDRNNCTAVDSIEILEPPGLLVEIDTSEITCFNEQNGSVIISKAEGGVLPWTSSLNGSAFQNNSVYNNLPAGNYILEIKDANGCTLQQEFILTQPDDWTMELGPDTTVLYGSSLTIEPEIEGEPVGMLQYLWSDDKCENCISRTLELNSGVSIQLVVTDENGCTAADIINLQVLIPEKIFIPNVFTPDGDGINDHFFVRTNPFIEVIDELSIFDRWGNMVFQKFNFPPNDPSLGWNGQFKEQLMNPAVFAYKVIVSFKDGTTRVYHGDVTLVR